jgi:hypothetical protein
MDNGQSYYGDGAKYREPSQREIDEQEAVTARAVAWLAEWVEVEGYTPCLCKRVVNRRDFASHAVTCRALRREVE